MEKSDYNVFDVLGEDHEVELDLKTPYEKEDEVKRVLNLNLNTKTEFFGNCYWQTNELDKIVFHSPTMTVGNAKKLVEKCPDCVEIHVSAAYLPNSTETIYEGSLRPPHEKLNSLGGRITELEGKFKGFFKSLYINK